MKRFFTIWLCIVMIIAMLPLATGVAFANEESFIYEGINYKITSASEVAVNKKQTTTEANIVIPATVTSSGIDYTVTAIEGEAFAFCSTLTTVTFASDSQLKQIGWAAFNNCGLTQIAIPASVESIGGFAFNYCKALSEIKIPKRVTSIGDNAFNNCTSLTNVEFEPDSQLKNIEGSVFSNCTNLEFVNLESCSQLETIGLLAFGSCSKLAKITIPASVSNIMGSAFDGCTNLATVTCLAITPPILNPSAFTNCNALSTIYVPAESVAAYKSAAGWSTYASKITTTAEGTYLNPWQIGATTPSNVNAWLVENTPAANPKTYTLHIEGNGAMKQLGPFDEDRPWNGYKSSISSVQISEGITSICDAAFKDCTALTNVTIPASVASIIDCAFKECTSLTTVTCLATTPPALGTNIFDGCTSLATIYVPYEAVEAYKSAANWSTYANIIQAIPGTEPQAPSIGYFVYDVEKYREILAEAQKLQAEIDAKLAEKKQTEEEKPIGTPITVEQAKALVTEMVPVVRTENQARGIMVTMSDSPAINRLKASGFKVLYDFYRAESNTVPAAEDYKITKVINKEEPWYLNTAAQAGKKYFYKAVAKVYDKDGNLVEETELTQGKYGMRTRK